MANPSWLTRRFLDFALPFLSPSHRMHHALCASPVRHATPAQSTNTPPAAAKISGKRSTVDIKNDGDVLVLSGSWWPSEGEAAHNTGPAIVESGVEVELETHIRGKQSRGRAITVELMPVRKTVLM